MIRLLEAFRRQLGKYPFRPHRWLRSGHLQTIVASRQRRKFGERPLETGRSRVRLPDGTAISVGEVSVSRRTALLVLHGMSGSSRSGFVRGLAWKAGLEGWGAFLPDLYDVSEPREGFRIFHAASSRPVGEMIRRLLDRHPVERVYLAGASMSGNILLRLLSEWGSRPPVPVAGAAVISPLVDLMESGSLLERPVNWVYRKYYVARLRQITLTLRSRIGSRIDWEELRRAGTVRQFDAAVTVPLSAYASVDEYYREGSALPLMPRIQIPTLILHSRDDPFLPWRPLLEFDNPALLVHLTDRGGHVAFLEETKTGGDRSWAENRAIDFFRTIERSFAVSPASSVRRGDESRRTQKD